MRTAQQRLQGTCEAVDLIARKTYNPSAWADAERQLPAAKKFRLPAQVPVISGNSGNHWITFQYWLSGVSVACRFKGGSSQSHPNSPAQLALAQRYVFGSCTNGLVAGELFEADALRLRVDNGDSYLPDTQVHLALVEEAPCGEEGPACDPAALEDDNPCTQGSCGPDGQPFFAALPAGTPCGEQDHCSGTPTCDGIGSCLPGVPALIDDGNPCTVGFCDPSTGHVAQLPVTQGTACPDGDVCNGTEVCDAGGVCQAGTPLSLEFSENPCVLALSCDPVSGVGLTFAPSGTTCGIAKICNGEGSCVRQDEGGGPVPGPPPGATLSIASYAAAIPRQPLPGCALEALDPSQVAIIAGEVVTHDPVSEALVPVANAQVTVSGRCEFGLTRTGADGRFQLALTGGERAVVRMNADLDGDGQFDFLTSERPVQTQWRETAGLEQVELIRPTPHAETVALVGGRVMADVVVNGPQTQDDRDGDGIDAPRTPSVLLKAGTSLTARDTNGQVVPLSNATIRMTEYTVGNNGISRMPAPLPPGTAYGYAVELSVDGAEGVAFDRPVVFYLDNFRSSSEVGSQESARITA